MLSVLIRHNISQSQSYVLDWSHQLDLVCPHDEFMTPGAFLSNILTTSSRGLQKDLWHLVAALDFVNFTSLSLTDVTRGRTATPLWFESMYSVSLCVINRKY